MLRKEPHISIPGVSIYHELIQYLKLNLWNLLNTLDLNRKIKMFNKEEKTETYIEN